MFLDRMYASPGISHTLLEHIGMTSHLPGSTSDRAKEDSSAKATFPVDCNDMPPSYMSTLLASETSETK